jgi:two-component system sensor histidine kinase VicK
MINQNKPKIYSFRWRIFFTIFVLLCISAVGIGVSVHFHLDLVIASVILILICSLIGYIIAGRLTAPISEISSKTAVMLGGNFSEEIIQISSDERGELASLYNELRIKLDENFSEIMTEKHKLEIILRQMTDGIVAVNVKGEFIAANDAAMHILHIGEEEVKSKHYDDIILRFSDDLTLGMIRKKLEAGAHDGRFSYGGMTYDVRFDIFRDTATAEYGVIVIIRDITDRLKIDNMQADFVANVSHELKTPLTSIKGYAETLISTPIDRDTAFDFLNIINSETDRMTRLVKDILQLSRLDSGQQKYDFVNGDVVALVRTAVKKMQHLAHSKDQTLCNVFEPDMTVLTLMDRDKIEQVVINIISNAIKYTNEGGRIEVDLVADEKDVVIQIADNGQGIPERDLPRIFERFFIVNKARTGQATGTGLGLAISKQIVEEHKGTIEIESFFTQGTKVTITLPLKEPLKEYFLESEREGENENGREVEPKSESAVEVAFEPDTEPVGLT